MEFKPIILGTDINAYGVARSFHEKYNLKSICLGKKPLRYTAHSSIVEVRTYDDFDKNEKFLEVLDGLSKEFHEKLILISCSDGYTSLISKNKDFLKDKFLFNYVDHDLQKALENKKDFYSICEEYGLNYPKTKVINYENYKNFKCPFDYPVALKPNDSIEYVKVKFEGKKKAYKIKSEQELKDVLEKIYKSDYKEELILQDFIPGDFSKMYVLNAYVNRAGKVKMMCLGKCLLDECLPHEIGNYNALMTMGDEEIYKEYKEFLEKINYRGFANFDLKYDERDGKYKVFEINIRQGRSSYYMTGGGCNFTEYIVDDLIYDLDKEPHYHTKKKIWLYVDPYVLKKYANTEDLPLIKKMLKKGYTFTQWYEKDRNFKRFIDYIKRRLSTIKYYPHYFEK